MLMRRLLASDWQRAKDLVAPLKNDPMQPCTQCTLYAEQQFLFRNIHQTKPGTSTEKQLRGQI